MLLADAQALSAQYPHTFAAPTTSQLGRIGPGTYLKVCANGERFWVVCISALDGEGGAIEARVDSELRHPRNRAAWRCGDPISLHHRHVLEVQGPEAARAFAALLARAPLAASGRDLVLPVDATSNRHRSAEELYRAYCAAARASTAPRTQHDGSTLTQPL